LQVVTCGKKGAAPVDQRSRSLQLYFQDTSRFSVTFTVKPMKELKNAKTFGRNLQFAGKTNLVGPCEEVATTTTTTTFAPPPEEPCPPPNSTTFKICSLWGDPHFPSTFSQRDFTAQTRHATENRGRVINHYDLGLFWLFKSKDERIKAQGFFCDARGRYNSLSMLVLEVDGVRLFWKRPDASLSEGTWGNHITKGHRWGMELTVDGQPMSAEDLGDEGFSDARLWFQQMHAGGWLSNGNEPLCLGTQDYQFTLKITTPGLSKVFEPALVLELASDMVDLDSRYLCSMEPGNKGDVRIVEPVPFDESLFTTEELHSMCDGCGLKAKREDPRHKDFSGCNPPHHEAPTAAAFCKERGASREILRECDHLEGDWKEACLVEVCAVGKEGASEADEFQFSGPDLLEDEVSHPPQENFHR
jgi:hypothetical protein